MSAATTCARRPFRAKCHIADELFFTGTAAEITPIRSVDRITVGSGCRGPVIEALQKAFWPVHGRDL
jgi:branched-chain amino acid aminotransferase